MVYCWNEDRNKAQNGIKVLFALILISVVIVEFVGFVYPKFTSSLWSNLFYIALSCAAAFLCGEFILLIAANERKYHIDEHGLTIGYPCGIRKFHTWDEITSIAVCKVHYIKKGPVRHKTAIRFVIGKERNGPEQATYADERWSKEMYEILHWGKIITIEFSEDRFHKVAAVSPLELSDYRHLPDQY